MWLIKLLVTEILLCVLIGVVLDIVSPCGMFGGVGSVVERLFFSLRVCLNHLGRLYT
jgi:hypothetical protein